MTIEYLKILIDPDDFDLVSKGSWYIDGTGHVSGRMFGKRVKLHRVILNAPLDKEIDHINRNPLDNRKVNLRLANKSQNMMNRGPQINNKSGIKGVCWSIRDKMWRVYLTMNRKIVYSSMHKILDDAINARKLAAIKFHGEFSYER